MATHLDRKHRTGLGAAIRRIVNPYNKRTFILDLPHDASLLDVGCGNNSPRSCKNLRPDIRYTGIDVSDYVQAEDPRKFSDQYVIASPGDFHAKIAEFRDTFDAVISAHNLEHCNEPYEVLRAMAKALKPGGKLFLAFPAEHTDRLPSRKGSLNFYDDPTHSWLPRYKEVMSILRSENITPIVEFPKYRPVLKVLQGLAFEPLSWWRGRKMPGTWALYGFETIVWARKTCPSPEVRQPAARGAERAGAAPECSTP